MLAAIAMLLHVVAGQVDTDASSVEFVCREHPERIERLFGALDLERKGLEAAKAAATTGDWPEACRALLDYYRSSERAAKLRAPRKEPSSARDPAGEAILGDVYTFYEVSDRVPRRPDGGLDWTYNGPTGDKEWGWGLNRQSWIRTLLEAYGKTGNTAYLAAFDTLIRDWVTSNPYPGVKNSTAQVLGSLMLYFVLHQP